MTTTTITRTEETAAHWQLGELDSVRTWADALTLFGGTDFSEYTTGVQPSGWTIRNISATWTIVDDAGATGGKVLRRASGGSLDNRMISWDTPGSFTDFDVITRLRVSGTTSSNWYHGLLARGSGSSSYLANIRTSSSKAVIALQKLTTGSHGSITGTGNDVKTFDYNLANGEWLWMRFKGVGENLYAKLWRNNLEDEPVDWDVWGTDADFASGYLGAFGGRYASTNNDFDVYRIAGNYASPGNRISPPLDVTAAGTYADSRVAWAADTPTDTTLTIDGFVSGETAILAEAVGTGDGVATVFTLDNYPAERLADLVVKIDGTATTAYTRVGRTLTFDAAPGDTLAITADYTGVDWPLENQAEVQTLDLDGPTGGTFKLGDGTTWTADLSYNTTAATIQTALEGLYGAGNVGVVPSWTPAELTLELWLDASMEDSITLDTSSVIEWADLSGNSRHYAQSTAGNRPTLVASVLNNLPVVRFAKTSSTYLSCSYQPQSPYHVIMVCRVAADTSGSFFSSVYGGARGASIGVGSTNFDGSGSNAIALKDSRVWHPTTTSIVSASGVLLDHESKTSGTDGVRVNGTSVAVSGSNTILQPSGGTSSLGGSNGGGSYPRYPDVDIAEVIIIDGAAPTSDREKIENYLSYKWGLGTPTAPYAFTVTFPLSIGDSGLVADFTGLTYV